MSNWIWIVAAVVAVAAVIKIITLVCTRRNRQTHTAPAAPSRPAASSRPSTSGLTELGPVNYYANDSHNSPDKWFQFRYKKVGNEWRTYILQMPSLRGRDPNLHLTHRYRNGDTYWICRDPQPTNLKDAQAISRVWADCIMEYIATGKQFH